MRINLRKNRRMLPGRCKQTTTEDHPQYSEADRRFAQRLKDVYTLSRQRHIGNRGVHKDGHETSFKWGKDILEAVEDDADKAIEPELETSKVSDVWLRLAVRVRAARIDPEAFIQAQFERLMLHDDPPTPQMLMGKRAFENYEENKERSWESVRVAFLHQQSKAAIEMVVEEDQEEGHDPVEHWLRVLCDPSLSLSALFRYCVALNIWKTKKDDRFKEVLASYRVEAALQYVRDADAYDHIWGDKWLPKGYRKRAYRIYDEHYS